MISSDRNSVIDNLMCVVSDYVICLDLLWLWFMKYSVKIKFVMIIVNVIEISRVFIVVVFEDLNWFELVWLVFVVCWWCCWCLMLVSLVWCCCLVNCVWVFDSVGCWLCCVLLCLRFCVGMVVGNLCMCVIVLYIVLYWFFLMMVW